MLRRSRPCLEAFTTENIRVKEFFSADLTREATRRIDHGEEHVVRRLEADQQLRDPPAETAVSGGPDFLARSGILRAEVHASRPETVARQPERPALLAALANRVLSDHRQAEPHEATRPAILTTPMPLLRRD
ncbi:hypothetical protein [Amycolatopsis sp. GA6-003]|uniref:hypothetical protein n=1 Tax=Amycolatopsis sp. GA6-003 TaxID=2652444 RepID=UPI0039173FBC